MKNSNRTRRDTRRSHAKHLTAGLFVALLFVGSVAPAQAGLLAAASSCSDEDQTAGFNGQSVDCAFACEGPGGVVSVSVRADDPDATVSGNGDCAGGNAHCDGAKTCDGTDDYNGDGAGTCNADSDEFYDSGLHVSCSAEVKDVEPPCVADPSCESPEWCIVTEPVRLCVDPTPPFAGLPPAVDEVYGEAVNTGRDTWESLPGGGDPPGGDTSTLLRALHGAVDKTVGNALDFDAGVEVQPIEQPSLFDASSADASVWERALSVLPTLPWEAATKDSYVFMHFDGETAIGITCRHGVCTDFQPVLINDPDMGFRLSTP